MFPFTASMCFAAGSQQARGQRWVLVASGPSSRTSAVLERAADNSIFVRVTERQEDEEKVRAERRQLPTLSQSECCLLESMDITRERRLPTGPFLTLQRQRTRGPVSAPQAAKLALVDDAYDAITQRLLAKSNIWDFNTFSLDVSTGGRALSVLLVHLFCRYGYIEHFHLDPVKAWHCFCLIEAGYHSNNPYHNAVHAADVTQAMHCFLQENQIASHLTPVEGIASLISAVAHDLDHPGVNQPFLIATSNHLASLYKNFSVLENHHWRSAVSCLNESGIFDHLPKDVWEEIEWQIPSLILATDITRQQEFLSRFRRYIDTSVLDIQDKEYRHFILQMALKCADLCNPCRPWEISKRWSYQVCQEFYRQGDYERQLNLPVTPMCDRTRTTIAKIQADFFRFVAAPLFEIWNTFFDSSLSNQLLTNLRYNHAEWEKEAARERMEREKLEAMSAPPRAETVEEREEDEEEMVVPLAASSVTTSSIFSRHGEDLEEDEDDRTPYSRRYSMPLSVPKMLPRTTIRRQSFPKMWPTAKSYGEDQDEDQEEGFLTFPLHRSPHISLRALSVEQLRPKPSIMSLSMGFGASLLRRMDIAAEVERRLVHQPTSYPPYAMQGIGSASSSRVGSRELVRQPRVLERDDSSDNGHSHQRRRRLSEAGPSGSRDGLGGTGSSEKTGGMVVNGNLGEKVQTGSDSQVPPSEEAGDQLAKLIESRKVKMEDTLRLYFEVPPKGEEEDSDCNSSQENDKDCQELSEELHLSSSNCKESDFEKELAKSRQNGCNGNDKGEDLQGTAKKDDDSSHQSPQGIERSLSPRVFAEEGSPPQKSESQDCSPHKNGSLCGDKCDDGADSQNCGVSGGAEVDPGFPTGSRCVCPVSGVIQDEDLGGILEGSDFLEEHTYSGNSKTQMVDSDGIESEGLVGMEESSDGGLDKQQRPRDRTGTREEATSGETVGENGEERGEASSAGAENCSSSVCGVSQIVSGECGKDTRNCGDKGVSCDVEEEMSAQHLNKTVSDRGSSSTHLHSACGRQSVICDAASESTANHSPPATPCQYNGVCPPKSPFGPVFTYTVPTTPPGDNRVVHHIEDNNTEGRDSSSDEYECERVSRQLTRLKSESDVFSAGSLFKFAQEPSGGRTKEKSQAEESTSSWCFHISRSLSAERPDLAGRDFDSLMPTWRGSTNSLTSASSRLVARRGSAPVAFRSSQLPSLGNFLETPRGGLRGGSTGGTASFHRRWSIPSESTGAGATNEPDLHHRVSHRPLQKELVRRHSFGLPAAPSSESENEPSSSAEQTPEGTSSSSSSGRNSSVPPPHLLVTAGSVDREPLDPEGGTSSSVCSESQDLFLTASSSFQHPSRPTGGGGRRRGSLPADIPISLMRCPTSSRLAPTTPTKGSAVPSSSSKEFLGGDDDELSRCWDPQPRRRGSAGEVLYAFVGPMTPFSRFQGISVVPSSADGGAANQGAQQPNPLVPPRRGSGGLELLSGFWRSRTIDWLTSDPSLLTFGRFKLPRQSCSLDSPWTSEWRPRNSRSDEFISRFPGSHGNQGATSGISSLLCQRRRGSVPLEMSLFSMISGSQTCVDNGK